MSPASRAWSTDRDRGWWAVWRTVRSRAGQGRSPCGPAVTSSGATRCHRVVRARVAVQQHHRLARAAVADPQLHAVADVDPSLLEPVEHARIIDDPAQSGAHGRDSPDRARAERYASRCCSAGGVAVRSPSERGAGRTAGCWWGPRPLEQTGITRCLIRPRLRRAYGANAHRARSAPLRRGRPASRPGAEQPLDPAQQVRPERASEELCQVIDVLVHEHPADHGQAEPAAAEVVREVDHTRAAGP